MRLNVMYFCRRTRLAIQLVLQFPMLASIVP